MSYLELIPVSGVAIWCGVSNSFIKQQNTLWSRVIIICLSPLQEPEHHSKSWIRAENKTHVFHGLNCKAGFFGPSVILQMAELCVSWAKCYS